MSGIIRSMQVNIYPGPATIPVRFPFKRKAALHSHVGLKSEGGGL
jgi:hypothetical protein